METCTQEMLAVSENDELKNVFCRIAFAAGDLGSLIVHVAALIGVIIMAVALYTLWKSGDDPSQKNTAQGAVVGLVVGALLIAVPELMWIIYNTILGS